MKKIMFFLGAVLFMCCCSTKEVSNEQSQPEFKENDSINYLFSYYDFKKEEVGCETYGFSGLESFGRWSSADTAIIDLMTAPMAEFTARFDIGRVGPEGEPLEFDVNVNGDLISHIATYGSEIFYVNVPKERVGVDGSTRIVIVFKNATVPGKYNPENTDGRKLGFALHDITVYGYSLKN